MTDEFFTGRGGERRIDFNNPRRRLLAVDSTDFDLVGLFLKDCNLIKKREMGLEPPELLTRDQEVKLARTIQAGDPEGGVRATGVFAAANCGLVVRTAIKRTGQGVPLSDLIQEGNLGLLRAAELFDPDRGTRFSTYATLWIAQAVTRATSTQGPSMMTSSVRVATQARRTHAIKNRLKAKSGKEPTCAELAQATGSSESIVQLHLTATQRHISLDAQNPRHPEAPLAETMTIASMDPRPVEAQIERGALLNQEIGKVLQALPPREARVLELRFGLTDGREHTLEEISQKFGLTRERIRQIEAEALDKLRMAGRSDRLRDFWEE